METRAISRSQFRKLVSPLIGLPISRPWLGYANALFLELGDLHWERLPVANAPKRLKLKTRSLTGQAGVMIEWHWRVERRGQFLFGSDKPSGFKGLRGRRLENVALSHCGPELYLELDGGLHVHTFSTLGYPRWTLFLRDATLFPRIPPSAPLDPSLLVTVDEELGLALRRSRRREGG